MTEQLYRQVVRTDGHEGHWFDYEPVEERTCTMERYDLVPLEYEDVALLRIARWWCSECNGATLGNKPKFCCECGARVVDE